ncbi:M12 family metallo-peptidase [Nemorincola caseinilytica]|uniref:M12 family metallo-peptidase n=1 Tax=Nemorincola caseinilytica TaxID=2054315 RepID=A0ABP8NR74_9BACT
MLVAGMCTLTASAITPIESFIARMKTTNTFAPVSNIWQADNNFDKKELLKYVEEVQPLSIDLANLGMFMQQKTTAISLTIPGVGGGAYTIELGRYDYFSNSFEVHARGENGKDQLVNYTRGLYYSGVVKGYPGSLASFSFFNGEVYGLFSIPDVGNFVLAPNSLIGRDENNLNYILYNDKLLKIKRDGPVCSTDQLHDEMESNPLGSKTTTFFNNNVYNNCTAVQVYEVVDYDMYVKKGSNVTTATNYMTSLFNSQATIYRNEGVLISLKYLQVNTASDEYMSIASATSRRFLYKFGWVTKNVMHGCDVALLASTRYGTMGGVAWLRAICRSYSASDSSGSYGFSNLDNVGLTTFPSYSWNVMVMAHEMGHMVGSPHTHACVWNPPARNTAIDVCQTQEGSCPNTSPLYPSGGGTIMSYCHLQSVGINFTKGFGTQPGDTIRRYIRSRMGSTSTAFPTCGAVYTPTTGLSRSNKKLVANRECTNITNTDTTTYYWFDKNTAAYGDDTLVLAIQKHGNFIGGLDSTGFTVETGTSPMYGSNKGDTMMLPTGITGATPVVIAMRRYWKINATATPSSPVTVMFPFTAQDTTDVDGSVPGPTSMANLKMYRVNAPVNPNPAIDSVRFTTAANVSVYTLGSAASTTNWAVSTVGSTMFANMRTSNLKGGGSGFYNSSLTSVEDIDAKHNAVKIYPNPTNTMWNVSLSGSESDELTIRLYSADGRLVQTQVLRGGSTNVIDATMLPAGMYFYRIVGGNNAYTGTLSKQ